MDRSRSKHEKELKRKAKKQAAAKAAAGDPWKNVPLSDDQFVCARVGNLKEDGDIELVVLRKLPGGVHSLASFLLDRGVIGLTSVTGYDRSSLAEFNEALQNGREEGRDVATASIADVRALVAGGARYAHEHGFRLPEGLARWGGMIGLPDWKLADTTPFRPEYAQTVAYARERLVGMTVEAFFDRPDITFDLPEGEQPPQVLPEIRNRRIEPPELSEWKAPTVDDYRHAFAQANKRRSYVVSSLRQSMTRFNLPIGPGFEDDAVATAAANWCALEFGPLPTALYPAEIPALLAEAFYFYAQIERHVLNRDLKTPGVLDVFQATIREMQEIGRRIGRMHDEVDDR